MHNAALALMEAASCVPGVRAHRYSGQQDLLKKKKTTEIILSRFVCGDMFMGYPKKAFKSS